MYDYKWRYVLSEVGKEGGKRGKGGRERKERKERKDYLWELLMKDPGLE